MPLDEAALDEEQEAVRAAVRRMPARDREILRLIAWEGLNPGEAAKVLEISGPAARVRLHRARARLRRELAHMDAGGSSEQSNRDLDRSECGLIPRTEEES
jgi:RNA polymerase sigma-70 factor (ECF subfamily)